MMNARWLLIVPALTIWLAPAAAVDLRKIERAIAKEPRYQDKPWYCLLVFGQEAKTRVWLVLDGDVLYADRNANGDLTEKGERITERQGKPDSPASKRKANSTYVFDIGEIFEIDKKTRHTDARLDVEQRGDEAPSLELRVMIQGKYIQYGESGRGGIRLADKPENAPVLHLNGPLTMRTSPVLDLQDAEGLDVYIGTPGLGKYAIFSAIEHTAVPKHVHPVAEITFSPKEPGKEPVKIKVVLKERC